MSGKHPHLNPLALRKELLIAESDLNRVQLIGDMVSLATAVNTLAVRALSFGSIFASAMALLSSFGKPAETPAKSSWLQTILKGVGLISTLWVALRPKDRHGKTK
jgi:hypothetical protein